MMPIPKIIISIAPVFLFLSALIYLDSFKLVKKGSVVLTILYGCVVAMACYVITTWALKTFHFDFEFYSKYISPVLEETFKVAYIVFLLKKKRIGFMVDGAIYGFAIGAGFAAVENLYYFISLDEPHILLWIIRGFGTAVMHGGTTCLFAILAKNMTERKQSQRFYIYLSALLVVVLMHMFFNHFFLNPFLMTVTQLILLPIALIVAFSRSEKATRIWLEIGFDTDVILLEHLLSGEFSQTKIGKYLHSLKNSFPGEKIADMLCYIRIHLELSIRAKGLFMLKEAGFSPPDDPEIKAKFEELKYLEKSIGKTGKLAIAPIFHTSTHDLWQLYFMR